MNRLAYCPNQSGYSAAFGNDVISQELDGGGGRYRRDIRRKSHTASVNWLIDLAGYQYITAFYRVWARNPSQPFVAQLVIDDELKDYECFFRSPINLDSQEGLAYKVSAQLEVKALISNDAFDDAIVAIGTFSDTFNPLDELANQELPNALGE